VLGEVDDDVPVLRSEHRVREVDREVEAEPVAGVEARPLVAVADLDRRDDAEVALRRGLLDDARALQQEHERTGAAVHDRDLRTGDVDVQVVDAEARERAHQVLDGRDGRRAFPQRRRQPRVADLRGRRRDRDGRGEIRAMEDDARLRRRRAQHEFDAGAGVQPDAGRARGGLEGALAEHVGVDSRAGRRFRRIAPAGGGTGGC